MPVPSPRNKILPVRGNIANLQANLASLLDGEICYAIDQDQYYQNEGGTLVSVGATKAQGALADTAVQPGDNVSDLTNDANYIDATGAPVQSVNTQTGDVVLDADDIDDTSTTNKFATAAQLSLADTSVQPGDNVSDLANDAGYITLAEVPSDAVTSVNTQTGDVVLDADDIDDTSTTHKFATAAQLGLADTSVQPGDNVSDLTNDANYIDASGAPVQSVNTQTGDVVLGAGDVGLGNVDNTSDANKPISTATQTALNAKADLVGGVIPTSQIPAIAITEFLGSVGSEAAMLALTGQQGDWCLRTDKAVGYVITGADPSLIANWEAFTVPGSAVTTINTQVGDVVLGAADVGAATAAQGALAESAVQRAGDTMTGALILPSGTAAAPALGVGSTDNGLYSPGTDQVALSTNGTGRLYINSSGAFGVAGANFGTAGQVLVSNGSSAAPSWEQITPSAVFGWDHDNDTYGLYLPGTSIKVSDLTGTVDVDVQSRIRRCVINDSGVVQYYLDADDSDLKAGDWLRIVETEALDTAYTGTHSESTNSLLRVGVPAWSAGTFTRGQRVTNGGYLWECITASTTATPAAGTVASDLTGTDGQVMVEVPAFSVRYGYLNGVHTREVRLGCSDSLIAQGFQPHPAFIKTDGSYKDAFYIGAYHTYDDAGTGSSVSGQTNTRSQTRATFRTEAEARGTGWHVLSYLELAAIQTLLVCEFQDYNSQKVIGNGSDAGTTYGVTTGQSDGDGNHSANSTDNVSDADDYMAYRGIENLYGRAWQFVDGINVYDRVIYLSNDQTAFADDTAVGYEFYAQVPTSSSSYQKELHPLPDVFLPSVVTGASSITYLGDAFWSTTGWRVALVGGSSVNGALVGAFCLNLNGGSGFSGSNFGSRLAYAAN